MPYVYACLCGWAPSVAIARYLSLTLCLSRAIAFSLATAVTVAAEQPTRLLQTLFVVSLVGHHATDAGGGRANAGGADDPGRGGGAVRETTRGAAADRLDPRAAAAVLRQVKGIGDAARGARAARRRQRLSLSDRGRTGRGATRGGQPLVRCGVWRKGAWA
eukprot:gene5251-14929_t